MSSTPELPSPAEVSDYLEPKRVHSPIQTTADNTIIYYSTPSQVNSSTSLQGLNGEPSPIQTQGPHPVDEDLEIVYTSLITSTSTSSHLPMWIIEIYSSLDRPEKCEFVDTLNESQRQFLFNSIKSSPSKLQEWEEIFKTQTENYKASTTPIISPEILNSNPNHLSFEAVSEELNNSLHHFRSILHSIEAESIFPATLKRKAEKYFSSIEQQFKKLFSTFQDHQAIRSTYEDESTQAAPLILNQDQSSQTGLSTTYEEVSPSSSYNLAYVQQGATTISSPVFAPQSSTTSLLLYPAKQVSDKESDLYNILFTELPAPKAKIENIKKIKSKGLQSPWLHPKNPKS
ncbi:hypothetical protein AVEN_120278-1 [Araneus ventricosus]|uniref:Uncharacterized protein n=1 Tax=Araneus ventricosus TaxID=182803 RepID=A0A4Y2T651_ARAVE|nr:hypothetical protein AVEN_120278-1 [Araneus ventricosus]